MILIALKFELPLEELCTILFKLQGKLLDLMMTF